MTDQELDRLLSQAAPMARDLWLSSLPGDGELPQARPSPAFQRRMDRLIRRMGRSPRRVRALAQVRRAAAVALVFLAVGFSGLMVEGMGYNRFFMFTAALSIPVAVLVVLAKRSGMLSAEESGKPPTP